MKRGLVDGVLLKPAQWKFLDEQAFTGCDNDANMVKIAILNLYLHQLERAHLSHHNPLTTGHGGTYPRREVGRDSGQPAVRREDSGGKHPRRLNHRLNIRSTELLFLKWFIDHLAPGGRAGVIVPNGVLFGSTNAATKLRELLLAECDLQAVIDLPSGVFKPYSGVGTAALIFQKAPVAAEVTRLKSPATESGKKLEPPHVGCYDPKSVWFYDLTADGYSLDG